MCCIIDVILYSGAKLRIIIYRSKYRPAISGLCLQFALGERPNATCEQKNTCILQKSTVKVCQFQKKSYLCSAFGKRHPKCTGYSAVGSVPGLGPGGRVFESRCPDE